MFSWINLFCIVSGAWEFDFGVVMLVLIADEVIVFCLFHGGSQKFK
jgi:hypothetical protein